METPPTEMSAIPPQEIVFRNSTSETLLPKDVADEVMALA
jgi:hypothetical protein